MIQFSVITKCKALFRGRLTNPSLIIKRAVSQTSVLYSVFLRLLAQPLATMPRLNQSPPQCTKYSLSRRSHIRQAKNERDLQNCTLACPPSLALVRENTHKGEYVTTHRVIRFLSPSGLNISYLFFLVNRKIIKITNFFEKYFCYLCNIYKNRHFRYK